MKEKNAVIHALIWKFLERCCIQGSSLIIGIILARLLSPDDYGTLSLLLVFINLSIILVNSGMNSALIQKKEVSEEDYATVFCFSITIAALLYIIIYIAAPFISKYYDAKVFIVYLRIIALVLFPNSINSLQVAKLSRDFQFKKMFTGNFIAVLVSGLIGILLASKGFGIWALIFQQLISSLTVCLIINIQVKWFPKLEFNRRSAVSLFSFGWKMMVSGILDTVCSDIRSLIIGKKFSSTDLGYYSQAKTYPQALSTSINTTISTVMFPAMAKMQDDKNNVLNIMRISLRVSMLCVSPVLIGLAVISRSVVKLFLTEKWLPCVPFIHALCIAFMFEPLITIQSQARNSLGFAGSHLKVVLVGKLTDIIILVLSMLILKKVIFIAYGQIVSAILASLIGFWFNKKIFLYGFLDLIRDILFPIINSFIMAFLIIIIRILTGDGVIGLLLQISFGVCIYVFLTLIDNKCMIMYLQKIIKELK